MKRFLCGIIALLVCMTTAGCGEDYGGEQVDVMIWDESARFVDTTSQTFSEPITPNYTVDEISGNFGAAFLKETAKTKENFVISPLSVKLALNMAALGAKGGTEKELLTLLGYEDSQQMREESRRLVSELSRADGSIAVNNSVWIDSAFEDIGENYTGEITEIFNAEFFREELSSKKIVKKLNGWISDKTKRLIPQMISEPFRRDTAMLLVNALYFNNEWVYEFEPYNKGFTLTFHGVNGDCETAGMYLKEDNISYGEGGIFRSVSLAYKDGSYMNIYLPAGETENVPDIIENLSPEELSSAMDIGYSERKVYINMPRFECDYSDSLKDMLKRLGVSEAFDIYAAGFGGMLAENSEEQLFISDVIHASKLKCNEKGTEAAAATVVVTADGVAIAEELPIAFIVDRPFIYEIKSPSGETLFAGVISSF